MKSNNSSSAKVPKGSIVLVAKCPIAGAVKTRLIQDLGVDGATSFARAMLCDILEQVGLCSHLSKVCKILLYAPADDNGRQIMADILRLMNLEHVWYLMPMHVLSSSSSLVPPSKIEVEDSTSSSAVFSHTAAASNCSNNNYYSDLKSSNLGDKLTHALRSARDLFITTKEPHNKNDGTSTTTDGGGAVVFLGMDSPEVNVDEIYHALLSATMDNTTHLCPAQDGGYGLICIPETVSSPIFKGVRWSDRLTCISQLKVLGDCGIRNVRVGQLMYDIDETKDMFALAHRLCHARNNNTNTNNKNNTTSESSSHNSSSMLVGDALEQSCFTATSVGKGSSSWQKKDLCKNTWNELCKLNVILPYVSENETNEHAQFCVRPTLS